MRTLEKAGGLLISTPPQSRRRYRAKGVTPRSLPAFRLLSPNLLVLQRREDGHASGGPWANLGARSHARERPRRHGDHGVPRGRGEADTPAPSRSGGLGTGRCRKRKERGRGSVFCWELWSGQHA